VIGVAAAVFTDTPWSAADRPGVIKPHIVRGFCAGSRWCEDVSSSHTNCITDPQVAHRERHVRQIE
jgi:hypothetical protein